MSSFWNGLFDYLKNCGRSVTMFFVTLGVLVGALILWGIIVCFDLEQFLPWVLGAAAIAAICRVGLAVWRVWRGRAKNWRSSPLSSDEIRVARSKLLKDSH